jgi:hypothetical protein
LPELFLCLPEVGSLVAEGGAMYFAEGRKHFAMVPSDVAVDVLVSVYAGNSSIVSMVKTSESESFGMGARLWIGFALS